MLPVRSYHEIVQVNWGDGYPSDWFDVKIVFVDAETKKDHIIYDVWGRVQYYVREEGRWNTIFSLPEERLKSCPSKEPKISDFNNDVLELLRMVSLILTDKYVIRSVDRSEVER